MKKYKEAYFTVEAAMVLPVIFATTVLLIFIMLFQYNRCVMEQDNGMILIHGSSMDHVTPRERVAGMDVYAGKIRDSKGIFWQERGLHISLQQDRLTVENSGSILYPLAGWQLTRIPEEWTATRSYSCMLADPVFFLRSFRKVSG